MTERHLVVVFAGAVAGEVTQHDDGRLELSYDNHWRDSIAATPLSLSMPLARRRHAHDVVSAFLWGLLPDNPTILQRWASAYQVSAGNPFALIANVGEDCAGAAQFVRPDRVGSLDPGDVEWLSDEQVAKRLRGLRKDPSAWQPISRTGQFSLAGAQGKTALLRVDGRWGIPSGAMATSHILKPAIEGFDDHDLNEHLCLQAARRLGFITARSEIVDIAGERAVVIERYDRVSSRWGDRLRRVHQEDACQALSVPPRDKYEADGGPSFARITELLRAHQTTDLGTASAARLLDAAALNWVLSGTDGHAKNYSLLLARGDVRLAPLYDVASSLPYDHLDPMRMKLAMKIGGEYEVQQLTARHWRRHAQHIQLDADRVVDRVREIVTDAPAALTAACEDRMIATLDSELPARLVTRVTEHARRCARMLDD